MTKVLVSLVGCPMCEKAKKDMKEDIKRGHITVYEVEEDTDDYFALTETGINTFPTIITIAELDNAIKLCVVDPFDDSKQACIKY